MSLGFSMTLVFFLSFVLTLWEYQMIHDLNPLAKWTSLRVLSSRGVLPERHSGQFTAPWGFRLRPLGRGSYVARPTEWHERGSGAGALMPFTFALIRVHGREWTLEARFGTGILLFFAAGAGTLLISRVMTSFTVAGQIAALAWVAFVVLPFAVQCNQARRTFSRLAATMTLAGRA
jgi:hypothetical protein